MGVQNSSMGDVALPPTSQGVSNISTAAKSKVHPRVVAATVAGNALEFFDFTTYAFFAVYIGWLIDSKRRRRAWRPVLICP